MTNTVVGSIAAACAIFVTPVGAGQLDERGLVEQILRSDPNLRILRIDNAADSLDLRAEQAGWLPQGTVTASVEQPLDGGEREISAGVSASQVLPGGASIEASASGGQNVFSTVDASVSQPLLAGAWRQGQQDYTMRVQRLNRQAFTLEQKKSLAKRVSDARSLYWGFCEAQQKLAVSQAVLVYARQSMNLERVRFSIGTAAVADTLDAQVEYLKAMQSLFADSVAWYASRRAVAVLLAVPSESVEITFPSEISVDSIPDAAQIVASARSWDPELDILELNRQRLIEELAHGRNALLPSASAEIAYSWEDRKIAGQSPSDNAVVRFLLEYSFPTASRRIGNARTRLLLEKSDVQSAERERELLRGIEELVRSWRLEQRQIGIASAALRAAKQHFEASRKGFELGTVDRLSYLKAKNDMLDLSIGVIERRAELKMLEISLDVTTGMVLEKFALEVQ